jgi:hypothetical protein
MALLLRKTYEGMEGLAPAIWWDEDDYSIDDDKRPVGRIYKEQIHGEWKWLWFLQIEPVPPPKTGIADTFDDAMAAFKKRYEEVKRR